MFMNHSRTGSSTKKEYLKSSKCYDYLQKRLETEDVVVGIVAKDWRELGDKRFKL